jgi:HEAT repeat protein
MNLPRAAIATPLPAPEPRPVEPPPPQTALALPAPSHLPKLDLIEELIKDLQEPHPDKRRKAIWELAQRADSRAVQPLIGLLIDSDSQQRGLILEALSQIGSRTLKPMNRALTIALQDENAQVRKNAIRDLTQMYELIAKLSKLLYLAVDDPDPEVQETAKWALNQLNNLKVPNVGDRDS